MPLAIALTAASCTGSHLIHFLLDSDGTPVEAALAVSSWPWTLVYAGGRKLRILLFVAGRQPGWMIWNLVLPILSDCGRSTDFRRLALVGKYERLISKTSAFADRSSLAPA